MTNIKRAISLVWQSSPNWMIANVIFHVIQSILPLTLLYIIKLIVDRIAVSISINDKQHIFADITFLLINAGAIVLWINFNTVIVEICSTTLSQRVTDYMQVTIFRKAIAIDLESYESAEKQDILERAKWEAPHRPTRMLSNLTTAFQNIISLTVISGLLLSLNWVIFVILLVASITTMFIRFWQSKFLYKWQRRQTQIERKANYFGHLILGDQPAKEIRIFGLGDVFIQRFYQLRQQLFKEKLAITVQQSLMRLITQGCTGLLMIGTYLFIIHQTIYGKFQLGDLVLYSQAFQRGQNGLKDLIASLSGLHENNLFLSDIFDFLALPNGMYETMQPKPVPSKMQKGIVFENVSFQHQNSSRKAIKQVNLKILPQEVVALVGENGSGKTTLVKLLCRLYDVTGGSITMDGVNIKNFAIKDLQRQISVIFQDYTRYQLTAKDNIWVGNIDLSPNSERIMEASEHSGADSVIKSLPQEYETLLGKWFQGGEELSGGQWQKIALARAFLRDAQLVMIEISIAQGVMPLLYQSLKEIDDVPPSVMRQLQTLNRMNGLNNLSQTKELLRILTQLEKSGIEAIAFKGAALAASAYGNLTLRQFNDLDILVQRRDFWQAKAVLISQGYQSNFLEEAEINAFETILQISLSYKAPEAEMFNARFEPSLLHSNPERSIDLHWGIPPRRTWNPNHYDRLWEYCQPMTLMGQSIKSFIPEIALIIQSVNLAKAHEYLISFKQICDVAQVIQAYPHLDWHLTLRLSSELRCEKLFLLGIYITQNLFNISVPEHILSKFIKFKIKSLDTQISIINSLDNEKNSNLQQIFYQNGILLPIRNLYLQYISPLKTLDSSLNRSWLNEAVSLYLYFLMKKLCVPNKYDHEFLRLPQQLFFLYYLVRPIRILWKYTLQEIYESGTKQKQ